MVLVEATSGRGRLRPVSSYFIPPSFSRPSSSFSFLSSFSLFRPPDVVDHFDPRVDGCMEGGGRRRQGEAGGGRRRERRGVTNSSGFSLPLSPSLFSLPSSAFLPLPRDLIQYSNIQISGHRDWNHNAPTFTDSLGRAPHHPKESRKHLESISEHLPIL